MPDGIDNETIMKAACIQAAATTLSVGGGNRDARSIVERAKDIFDEMETQEFFPSGPVVL